MTSEEWRTTFRNLSDEDLREVSHLVRDEVLAREAHRASELRIGDLVEFQDREGAVRQGNVVRINVRSVTVHCCPEKGHQGSEDGGHTWRVSPGLLRRVPTPENSTV